MVMRIIGVLFFGLFVSGPAIGQDNGLSAVAVELLVLGTVLALKTVHLLVEIRNLDGR